VEKQKFAKSSFDWSVSLEADAHRSVTVSPFRAFSCFGATVTCGMLPVSAMGAGTPATISRQFAKKHTFIS